MRPFFGNTSFFTRESPQSGHHAVRAIPTLFLSPRGIKVEAINDERFCDSPFKSATNIVKSPNKASSLCSHPRKPAPTFLRAVYPIEGGTGRRTDGGWGWATYQRSAQGKKWRNNSGLGLVFGRAFLSIRGKAQRSTEVGRGRSVIVLAMLIRPL